MKFKRFLPICLLAGSLLLTSCEDLLNNFMNGGKKDNDSSEKRAYQGKQGATKLSKDEWEQAFSLEEMALRRNCHLEVTQDEVAMKMDIDNGKWKINVPYSSGQNLDVYFEFTDVAAGLVTGTYYYPDGNGGYQTGIDKEPLNLAMAEFGIIYLEYDKFEYDSSSKMYKADNYHYEVSYQGQTALSLDCEDCKVTIEDGFPKKLECEIVAGADGQEEGEAAEPTHYEAVFSRYNAITVNLPNGSNNGGNNGGSGSNYTLPAVTGTEISYDDLYNAYLVKPTANFTNAVVNVTADTGTGTTENVTVTASLVDGVWKLDGDIASDEEVDLSTLIISEEMIVELREELNTQGVDAHIYQNTSKGKYAISMSQTAYSEGEMYDVQIQLYMNEYFYVTAEYIVMNSIYEAIEIEWLA